MSNAIRNVLTGAPVTATVLRALHGTPPQEGSLTAVEWDLLASESEFVRAVAVQILWSRLCGQVRLDPDNSPLSRLINFELERSVATGDLWNPTLDILHTFSAARLSTSALTEAKQLALRSDEAASSLVAMDLDVLLAATAGLEAPALWERPLLTATGVRAHHVATLADQSELSLAKISMLMGNPAAREAVHEAAVEAVIPGTRFFTMPYIVKRALVAHAVSCGGIGGVEADRVFGIAVQVHPDTPDLGIREMASSMIVASTGAQVRHLRFIRGLSRGDVWLDALSHPLVADEAGDWLEGSVRGREHKLLLAHARLPHSAVEYLARQVSAPVGDRVNQDLWPALVGHEKLSWHSAVKLACSFASQPAQSPDTLLRAHLAVVRRADLRESRSIRKALFAPFLSDAGSWFTIAREAIVLTDDISWVNELVASARLMGLKLGEISSQRIVSALTMRVELGRSVVGFDPSALLPELSGDDEDLRDQARAVMAHSIAKPVSLERTP